jgi:tetratricopeptide (TPR) repeat protein
MNEVRTDRSTSSTGGAAPGSHGGDRSRSRRSAVGRLGRRLPIVPLRKRLSIFLVFTVLIVTGSGDSGVSNESRITLYRFRGDSAFTAQDYSKAVVEYRDVLRISPQDPVATRQLGIIYSDQGQLAKAYKYLRQAALLEPENDTVQLKLGAAFLAVGGYSEARDAAMRILARQPDDEEALLLLIDAVHAPGEIQETRQRIETLRQTHSDRAGYHVALGMLDLHQRDPSNAERELKEALQLDPKSGAAQFALGNIYWMRNELEEADRLLGAAAKVAPLRSTWRLRYADFQRQTGRFEAANNSLAEITARAPDYLLAWIDLMNLACKERRDRDCADIIGTIVAQDPVNYEALSVQANLKLADGKVLEALIEFDRLRSLYYRVPEVHYHVALAELASHNVDAAVRSLTQAITLAPDFDDAILLRDDINISRGDLAPAIASLMQVVQQRPQRISAHLLLADAYLIQKNSDQALTVYRQMVKLFPQDFRPSFLIGMLFARQNQPEDARMAFEESLRIAPAYLPALEQLVGLDLAENRVAAATKRVQAEIEKHPGIAGLWCLEGEIDLAQQDFSGAEVALLKAVDLDGNLEAARLLLAADYVAAHKYDNALHQLVPFAAKNDSVAALMQIGLIQTELRQFAAARDAYERLLVIDPNFGPALNNLANIYSEQLSQLDKAYQLAQRARKVLPDDPHAADTLGWIYFRKGMYHSALALLEQSAAKLPAEPEPQFHLGMALYKVDRRDEAMGALQRAAGASKDFPDKAQARRQIDQLAKEPVRLE